MRSWLVFELIELATEDLHPEHGEDEHEEAR